MAEARQSDVQEIEQNPPIRQEGNSIHIDYVNYRNISVDYEITVPAETTVRTHSGSGDQTIEGTHGNADVQTGSGDVKLAKLTGEIRLQTGSGNVRAREIAGSVKGGAGSGDIEIEETGTGDVDLHTGSGNITVRGIQGGFRGEAGSGDITAEGTQSGPWEIRTGSGNVRVRLPSNCRFRRRHLHQFRDRRRELADRDDRAGPRAGVAQADSRQSARRRPVALGAHGLGRRARRIRQVTRFQSGKVSR